MNTKAPAKPVSHSSTQRSRSVEIRKPGAARAAIGGSNGGAAVRAIINRRSRS